MKVLFKKNVSDFLKRIPHCEAKKLIEDVKVFKTDPPFMEGLECLERDQDRYSLRSGNYRTIFQKYSDNIFIFAITIGHQTHFYNSVRRNHGKNIK